MNHTKDATLLDQSTDSDYFVSNNPIQKSYAKKKEKRAYSHTVTFKKSSTSKRESRRLKDDSKYEGDME